MDMREVRYKKQMYHAKKRGIPFRFSLTEWISWWESRLGPNWLQLRGCKKGQYCMARKGDKGPYTPSNVDCVLASENSAQKNHKGDKNPNSRAKVEQIREIRASDLSTVQLAKRFGLAPSTIDQIKNRTRWKSV